VGLDVMRRLRQRQPQGLTQIDKEPRNQSAAFHYLNLL
jgi:hypothetical protein